MSQLEMEFENNVSSEALKTGQWSEFSDYGSGDTSNSSSMSWGGLEQWPTRTDFSNMMRQQQQPPNLKSSSLVDLMSGRSINDVMAEFQMNGFDSPYYPEDDPRTEGLSSSGPAGVFLRQKSWPEPERTPVQRLPRWNNDVDLDEVNNNEPLLQYTEVVTEEQRRVLSTLPPQVLQALLRQLEQEGDRKSRCRRQDWWCRFCRNNGERESYYRSHALKDAAGRVRCPVLRAFVCPRCGARGDAAHTIKYCPLSTPDERVRSAAMMRSVRLAAGRRRATVATAATAANTAPPAPPAPLHPPLHPLWAALEQKLML